MSLLICTRSPTTNEETDDVDAVVVDDEVTDDDEGCAEDVPLAELLSDWTPTLVRTAGLNVHLGMKASFINLLTHKKNHNYKRLFFLNLK